MYGLDWVMQHYR